MTPLPEPEAGLVIRYSYLWRQEALSGREEGSKDPPCAIVLTSKDMQDETIVFALPVTHSAPANEADTLEIPRIVKQRLGLDGDRSWVVVTEINRFVWPGPDLRYSTKGGVGSSFAYGQLPPRFFAEIRTRWLKCFEAQRMKIVRRTE